MQPRPTPSTMGCCWHPKGQFNISRGRISNMEKSLWIPRTINHLVHWMRQRPPKHLPGTLFGQAGVKGAWTCARPLHSWDSRA